MAPLFLNGTTGISGVDGSSAIPALQGVDTNTGITFPAADTIGFVEGGTEVVRIDSSGRLLVGTSSSDVTVTSALQIAGTGFGATQLITRHSDANTTDSAQIGLLRTRGTTAAARTIVLNGDELGRVGFSGTDGSTALSAAAISASVDGTPGANDMPGRLIFSTTADGASTPTERMRIGSGGGFKVSNNGSYNLGTDIHEINHNVNGSAALHIYQSTAVPYGIYVKFTGANPNNATSYVFTSLDNAGANIYTIYSNGTVGARSDAKFKKNIETTRNGYLEDLAQLRVVKYNWHNHDDGTTKELGFIAQEVEQVFPGLVSTVPDKDDQGNETGEFSKSIKTSVFTPMLVKALQEALERIEQLEAKVEALEAS